jgi:hypothetical protein
MLAVEALAAEAEACLPHLPVERARELAARVAATPLPPPDLDELFGFLNKRRTELLAILRKSIELDEQLLCSI